MEKTKPGLLFVVFLFTGLLLFAQDSSQIFNWNVSSKKISDGNYELIFSTTGNKDWQLYSPNQVLNGVATTELQFSDSAIKLNNGFRESGGLKTEKSQLFEVPVSFYNGPSSWTQIIRINGTIPATLQGTLLYT